MLHLYSACHDDDARKGRAMNTMSPEAGSNQGRHQFRRTGVVVGPVSR